MRCIIRSGNGNGGSCLCEFTVQIGFWASLYLNDSACPNDRHVAALAQYLETHGDGERMQCFPEIISIKMGDTKSIDLQEILDYTAANKVNFNRIFRGYHARIAKQFPDILLARPNGGTPVLVFSGGFRR